MQDSISTINDSLNNKDFEGSDHNYFNLKELMSSINYSIKQLVENKKAFTFTEKNLATEILKGL